MGKKRMKILSAICLMLLEVELITTLINYKIYINNVLFWGIIIALTLIMSMIAYFMKKVKSKWHYLLWGFTFLISLVIALGIFDSIIELIFAVIVLALSLNPSLILIDIFITIIILITIVSFYKVLKSKIKLLVNNNINLEKNDANNSNNTLLNVGLVGLIFLSLALVVAVIDPFQSEDNNNPINEFVNVKSNSNMSKNYNENQAEEENSAVQESEPSITKENEVDNAQMSVAEYEHSLDMKRQAEVQNGTLIDYSQDEEVKSASIAKVNELITEDTKAREELNVDKLAYDKYPDDSIQGFANGIYNTEVADQYELFVPFQNLEQYTATFDLLDIPADKYLTAEEYETIQQEQVAYEIGTDEYATVLRPLTSYSTLLSAGYGTNYFGQDGRNLLVGTWPKEKTDELMISNRVAQNLCEQGMCDQIDELIGQSITIPFVAYNEIGVKYNTTLTGKISGIYLGMVNANDIVLAADE